MFVCDNLSRTSKGGPLSNAFEHSNNISAKDKEFGSADRIDALIQALTWESLSVTTSSILVEVPGG